MPAPGRGTAVAQTGTVTAHGSGTVTVAMAGESYQLPYISAAPPPVGATVWVAWLGRTGLVLHAADPNAPAGCYGSFTMGPESATFTMTGSYTVGVYGTFGFDAAGLVFTGSPASLELRITAATNVDAAFLDPLPGPWEAVTPAQQFVYSGWGWGQGGVTGVVFELRWTGTAQVAAFCPFVIDNQ